MEASEKMRRLMNLTIACACVCWSVSLVTSGVVVHAGESQARGADPKASAPKNPVPSTPQSIAAGKSLYQKYCRQCHGDDAKGNGPQAPEGTNPPNLTDTTWNHGSSDAEIFAVIKDGIGPKFDMKGNNSKMTPQEMWSIVNYLRSIGPQDSAD